MKKIIITLSASVFILSGCYNRPDGGARVRPFPNNGQQQVNQIPPHALPDGIPLEDQSQPQPYAPTSDGVAFPMHDGFNNIPPANQVPTDVQPNQTAGLIPPTTPSQTSNNTATGYQQSVNQSNPVQALLNDANAAVASNQLDRAASALDRAVRLEPKNASIWYDLAQIRLHQGKYELAEQLARRSISFAGNNSELTKKNWRIISSVKKAQGDTTGANEALRNAQ